ncbi:MAG: DUF885 domain-containing protein [Lachnospiraceae bacterium]|nr:DUF885 domain-containing protein [Lachnospiraceae bacterium]
MEKTSAAEDSFSVFLDEFFQEYATADSLSFHYTVSHPEELNLELPAPSLGQFSKESLLASNNTAAHYLTRLQSFSKESLTTDEQFTYDLVGYALTQSILPEETLLYDSPLGPTTGLQTQLPVLLAEYRFSSLKDVEDYFLLLEDMPRYFSQLCDFERARSAAGTGSCAEVLSRILLQCKAFVEDPGNNFLIESFRDRLTVLPDLTPEQTAELCIRNQKLVFTKAIPAYEQLIETLEGLIDTSVPAVGLAAFPGGAGYYESLVKSNTGSDKSIEELELMLQKALTENMRIMAVLYQSKTLQEELKVYQKQGLSMQSASSDISAETAGSSAAGVGNTTHSVSATEHSSGVLTQLQTRICNDFPAPAEASFRVESVHPSLEDFISPAFYLVPPFDCYTDNVIYINGAKCSAESLYSTLAHEGYPGHLYQNTFFASTSPHPVRMLLNFTGYDEGWGTYAELYSYQYADCSEELRRFLIAEQIAGLCLYSLSDIRIHYHGADFTAVSAFLQEYGFSPEAAEEIFYTQLAEPGIYLPYSVGYLEICELRDLYLNLEGADASLLPFHTFLLETGPAPFKLLKEALLICCQ